MTESISGFDTLVTAQQSGKDSSSSSVQLFEDMEAFLYLLTQQLQFQDPLDPMDTSEYTNQLVQYAQVEQQIQSNSYLETIVSQNINAVATQAISYMDQTVQALSDYVPLQDGYAKFSYILESDAAACTALIYDTDGNIVKTYSGLDLSAGRHELEWDGKDKNGDQLDDGAYVLKIAATDATGATVKVQKTVFGKVTGVAYDGDSVAVGMGEVAVDMNSILAVHDAASLTPPEVDTEGDADGGETPDETKPDETKPDETKPGETKPEEGDSLVDKLSTLL